MYESNPDALCNYFDGPINYDFTLITCFPPIRGQFVQIQYKESENSVINLYEIEVHGVQSASCSLGGPVVVSDCESKIKSN